MTALPKEYSIAENKAGEADNGSSNTRAEGIDIPEWSSLNFREKR
jgi:hypothetical protein